MTEAARTEYRKLVATNGKTYHIESSIDRHRVHYYADRDGKRFGATHFASRSSRPGTVGAEIWAYVAREFGNGDGLRHFEKENTMFTNKVEP